MRKIYKGFIFLFGGVLIFSLLACRGEQKVKPSQKPTSQVEFNICRDLDAIKKDGVLSVITLYNSTSYFLYRGRAMGFEYEMAERLAKSLGLELEIKIAHKFENVFQMLNSGKGDLIAFGLSITQPRKEKAAFTDYLYLTHQVLVQRKPENWRRLPRYKIQRQLINDAIGLIGDTIHIQKGTSYYARIQHLEEEIGGNIDVEPVDPNLTTDAIIKKVVEKEIDYTIADNNIASIMKTYYPILDIDTEISFSQRIAWAVRKNSPELLKAVNDWIAQAKKQDFYYVLYNKYFKNRRRYQRQISSEFYSKNEGKISVFDNLIQKNAERLGWDWRLLSSLIYQESRFKILDESWTGARGLMQLMPATAKELGVEDITDPRQNIRGGTVYLKKMYGRFDRVQDRIQRIKFAMASYNCGYGHVRDAQRLTKAMGGNPLRWDGNVEKNILKLSKRQYFSLPQVHYGYVRGSEPYNYVLEIFQRYEHYRQLIPYEPDSEGQS